TLGSGNLAWAAGGKPMGSFDEHGGLGLGDFPTRAEVGKPEGGPSASSILQAFNGLSMVRGQGGRAWITAAHSLRLIKTNSMDQGLGAHPSCYAQVYLDQAPVYQGQDEEPLFDVNSIPPSQIEAIEYYATPA